MSFVQSLLFDFVEKLCKFATCALCAIIAQKRK